MERDRTSERISQALAGREPALGRLIGELTPVIQARVARVLLLQLPEGASEVIRQQVEDLTQEVFLSLFADGGRILRSWEPERGLSLPNFVGLVAKRRALSLLRRGPSHPWKAEFALEEDLDPEAPEAGPELQAATRQQLRLLLRRLQEELSPLGWHLFELLLMRELPVAEVEGRTGMTRDALYTWRSRLRRQCRAIFAEIVSESREEPRIPEGRHA